MELSFNLTLGLFVVLFIISFWNLWQTWQFQKAKKAFFSGSNGMDLEHIIVNLKQQLEDLQKQQDALEQAHLELKEKSTFAIQRVGLIRFNPFKGSGGNFSFSLALLDDRQNGIMLTSMYGREQNRIYTKKIENGHCESQLTEEELQAVHEAINNKLN